MRLKLLTIATLASLVSCEAPHCETSDAKWRTWESLPVTVSTDKVYSKIIDEAILEFNTQLGLQAFEFVESDGDVLVSYADFSGSTTLGATKTQLFGDDLIYSADIYLSYDLDYELAIAVMQHELGHALGRRGHDASGLMYCFTDDSNQDYTIFIKQFEEAYYDDTNATP